MANGFSRLLSDCPPQRPPSPPRLLPPSVIYAPKTYTKRSPSGLEKNKRASPKRHRLPRKHFTVTPTPWRAIKRPPTPQMEPADELPFNLILPSGVPGDVTDGEVDFRHVMNAPSSPESLSDDDDGSECSVHEYKLSGGSGRGDLVAASIDDSESSSSSEDDERFPSIIARTESESMTASSDAESSDSESHVSTAAFNAPMPSPFVNPVIHRPMAPIQRQVPETYQIPAQPSPQIANNTQPNRQRTKAETMAEMAISIDLQIASLLMCPEWQSASPSHPRVFARQHTITRTIELYHTMDVRWDRTRQTWIASAAQTFRERLVVAHFTALSASQLCHVGLCSATPSVEKRWRYHVEALLSHYGRDADVCLMVEGQCTPVDAQLFEQVSMGLMARYGAQVSLLRTNGAEDSRAWLMHLITVLSQRAYERPQVAHDVIPAAAMSGSKQKKAGSLKESWHRVLMCVPRVSPFIARSLERTFPTANALQRTIRLERDWHHGVSYNTCRGQKTLDDAVAATIKGAFTSNDAALALSILDKHE